MRPVVVMFFAIAIFGSLYAYLAIAERPVKAAEFSDTEASGQFQVQLTIPFDCGVSGFELDDSGESLVVQLDGRVLLKRTDMVKRGVLTVDNVEGLKIGRNEFVVAAQPKSTASESSGFSLDEDATEAEPLPVPIRLQVFRDGVLIGEKTTWNSPGLRLVSSVMVEITTEFEAE